MSKVQLHSDRMPGNNYDGGETYSSSARVGRLLREREIRKNIKASQSNEAIENNNRGNQPFGNDVGSRKDDHSRVSSADHCPEGAAGSTANHDGYKKQDGGRPTTQRLLVVANRLPVSAVRRGEDVWSLEISAGGLVSALLGMQSSNSYFLRLFVQFGILVDSALVLFKRFLFT